MKTIGLVGGMSWESTTLYYQAMNREVARRLGGLHSASVVLVSLDFDAVAVLQQREDWRSLGTMMADAAVRLERAGAGCVLLATNTMHRVAPEVAGAVSIPLLHIADATARAVLDGGLACVGLLGTRFTMEQPFYTDRLAARGITCLVPGPAERQEVHRIIFDELCRGIVTEPSRQRLLASCSALQDRGAQGIILGCTELPMILKAGDLPLPLFDTTTLHALAAVDYSLSTSGGALAPGR